MSPFLKGRLVNEGKYFIFMTKVAENTLNPVWEEVGVET